MLQPATEIRNPDKPDEPQNPTTRIKPDDPDNPDNPPEKPVYSYKITVEDNDGCDYRNNCNGLTRKQERIKAVLPEGKEILPANRIVVTVKDSSGKPVKGVEVEVATKDGTSASDVTNSDGVATVPPVNTDYTDVNGYAEVDGLIVIVVNETAAVENAFITHHAEIKNEDGSIKTAEYISVLLPVNTKFDYKNRITVTVLKKAENSPVQNIRVTASEADVPDTETKSLSNITNAGGIVVFPALTEDITDDNGNSDVSETTPGKGEDIDGDGNEDVPGEDVETKYTVSVKDTQGIISNAFVEIKDGKIYVTLPETHTLTTSNQTTVTVTDKDGKAVQGVSVTIKDKTTEKTAATNASGQVTLPVKSSGGGGSSSGGSSGGGGGGYSGYSTVNVKVTDKDGKTVSVTKSVDSKG